MNKTEVSMMEIHTPRLTLRPAGMDDLHTTHAYASDLENTRFMMYLPYASLEETAQMLREAEAEWQKPLPESYEFAILLEGQHIGGITLYMQEDRTHAELGWVLHKAYWRRGYVTEAAQGVISFAKEQLGVQRIFACCDSENVASYKTMEKLGMHLVKDDGVRTNRSMGDEVRRELTYEVLL